MCECDYYDHRSICICEGIAAGDDGLCSDCHDGEHLLAGD